MGRRIGVLAGLAMLLLAGAAIADNKEPHAFAAMPLMVPSADETPAEGTGSDKTDALLNCYEKFSGPQPDFTKISPPQITHSPTQGFILRADFRKSGTAETVDRLSCWSGGFTTQKNLTVAPLYPHNATRADPATDKVITGWQERRKAEALKRATARRLSPPDAKTIALLEGIWLIDKKPDQGSCLSHWYRETQVEFDFHKSGGRALIFEPYDLFTAISLSGAEWTGDVLEIQGQIRGGGLAPLMRLRIAAPGRLEILPPDGNPGAAKALYRCGEPDRAVNNSMSPEQLAAFIAPVTLGGAFLPAVAGTDDADVCAGKVRSPGMKFLQIEPYGPVHYWILGMGFKDKHRFAFDYIRAIRPVDAHTIKLDMQEHFEKGDGWDVPESRGATYQLTIIDTGARLEIPELATSFVKCKADAAANVGMHRW